MFGQTFKFEKAILAEDNSLEKEAHGSAYRADIDGLRALAVVAVVLFHINPSWCPGGFAGVDMFFVISGFVVTTSMMTHRETQHHMDFINFFARRLKRLQPCLLLAVLVSTLVLNIVCPPWNKRASAYSEGLYGVLGVSNVHLALQQISYWDSDIRQLEGTDYDPFIHLWSLGVEEQFYLIFPFLFRLDSTPTWLGLGAISALLCMCWSHTARQTWSFYLLAARFWQLMVGVQLCYLLKKYQSAIQRLIKLRLELVVVRQVLCPTLLIAALLFTPSGEGYPHPWSMLLPIPAASIFIIAGVSEGSWLNTVCSQSWLVFIGQISYPIYVWHQPVLALLRHVLDNDMVWAPGLILTLLLAIASHYAIEKPMWRKPVSRPYWVVIAWLGAALGTCIIILLLKDQISLYTLIFGVPFVDNANIPAFHRTDSGGCACRVVSPTFHIPPGAVNDGTANLPPCFVDRSIWWDKEYDQSAMRPKVNHGNPEKGCFDANECWRTGRNFTDGDKTQGRVMFLLGDSHAEELSPGLEAATNLPIFMLTFHDVTENHYATIEEKMMQVLHEELREGDVVVVHMWGIKFNEPAHSTTKRDLWTRLFTKILQETSVSKATFVLLSDVPKLQGVGPRCMPTALKNESACGTSLAESRTYTIGMHELLAEFALKGAHVMDFQPLLCGKQECNERVPGTGTLAYHDSHHINRAASLYLSPFLCSYFAKEGILPHTGKRQDKENSFKSVVDLHTAIGPLGTTILHSVAPHASQLPDDNPKLPHSTKLRARSAQASLGPT